MFYSITLALLQLVNCRFSESIDNSSLNVDHTTLPQSYSNASNLTSLTNIQDNGMSLLRNFPTSNSIKLGDINFGGLFEIYKPSLQTDLFCSDEYDNNLISKAYAMKYAVERYDAKFRERYNLSLGYYILPTCTDPLTAQLQSINLRRFMENRTMVGVVGPFSSEDTLLVSPYLSFHQVSHLSYGSNANFLNGQIFSHLFRLISSQTYFVRAITAWMKYFKWNVYSTIYSIDSYNMYYANAFRSAMSEINACVFVEIKIPVLISPTFFSQSPTSGLFDQLMSHQSPMVTVMFLTKYQFIQVLKNIKHLSQDSHRLIIIALDTWPDINELEAEGLGNVTLGAITFFEIYAGINDFVDWMKHRKNNSKSDTDPWYKQWYQSASAPNRTSSLAFDKRVAVIIDIVSTLVIALENLIINSPNCSLPIRSLKDCSINAQTLYFYIKNISFTGRTGKILFTSNQIVQHKIGIENTVRGIVPGQQTFSYSNILVGTYDASINKLHIFKHVRWQSHVFMTAEGAPPSYCSLPCAVDEITLTTDKPCCWKCIRCGPKHYFLKKGTRYQIGQNLCNKCPFGTISTQSGDGCEPLPPIYLTSRRTATTFIYLLASLGLVAACLLLVIYIKNYKSRVFLSEVRPLVHLLFLGVVFGFVAILLLISPPTSPRCGFGHFLLSFSFTLIYAASLGKIMLISNELRSRKGLAHRRSFENNIYYTIGALCLFQIIINGVIVGLEWRTPVRVENTIRDLGRNDSLGGRIVLETYCHMFAKDPSLLAILLGYEMIILMGGLICTLRMPSIPSIFKEALVLRITIYFIITLYILAIIMHFSLVSFNSVIVYIFLYIAIIYCVIITNTLFKIKSVVDSHLNPIISSENKL